MAYNIPLLVDRFSGFNVKPDKGRYFPDIRVVSADRMKPLDKCIPK